MAATGTSSKALVNIIRSADFMRNLLEPVDDDASMAIQ